MLFKLDPSEQVALLESKFHQRRPTQPFMKLLNMILNTNLLKNTTGTISSSDGLMVRSSSTISAIDSWMTKLKRDLPTINSLDSHSSTTSYSCKEWELSLEMSRHQIPLLILIRAIMVFQPTRMENSSIKALRPTGLSLGDMLTSPLLVSGLLGCFSHFKATLFFQL